VLQQKTPHGLLPSGRRCRNLIVEYIFVLTVITALAVPALKSQKDGDDNGLHQQSAATLGTRLLVV
jgi:hypothetical protein